MRGLKNGSGAEFIENVPCAGFDGHGRGDRPGIVLEELDLFSIPSALCNTREYFE